MRGVLKDEELNFYSIRWLDRSDLMALKKERDWVIIEVLAEEGPQTWTQLKEKTPLPDGTLDRGLKRLTHLGIVQKVEDKYGLPKDVEKMKKEAWLEMPEELRERGVSIEVVFEARRRHKLELVPTIQSMMDELMSPLFELDPRKLSTYAALSWSGGRSWSGDLFERLSQPSKIENTWEFKHLKEHISEVVKRWADYKRTELPEQYRKSKELVDDVGRKIVEYIGSKTGFFPLGYSPGWFGIHQGYPELLIRVLAKTMLDGRKYLPDKLKRTRIWIGDPYEEEKEFFFPKVFVKGRPEGNIGRITISEEEPKILFCRLDEPDRDSPPKTIAVFGSVPGENADIAKKLEVGKELIDVLMVDEIWVQRLGGFFDSAESILKKKREIREELDEILHSEVLPCYCHKIVDGLK